jgi:hypothetical protein
MSARDPHHAIIERAVRAAALALWAREQTVAEVTAALAAAVASDAPADITPRERVAEARHARREKMVAEVIRLEREGRGRSAVMLVARKFAHDSLDAVELESLARALRRWRKKIGQCPVACPKSG